jgi:signal transduction histidine kinase
MNLIEMVTSTTPSAMSFAIGEQVNALMGVILCLMAMWDRMENPKRTGGIILAVSTVWFILCGFICGLHRIPTFWTVIPTAIIAVLVFSKVTDLTVSKALLLCSTAAYVVAIIYYLSLVMDVTVLGEQSVNLRVGWPGLINLLVLDIIAPLCLWHPLHDSIPPTLDSPAISPSFWRLIWLFPFISTAIVVWCLPADNDSIMSDRVRALAFTIAITYSCFMTLAYLLIWYMIRQSDRLLEAARREHYEAMQTIQLQHMNERIREARQIRHNTRHHIQTLQTLASANDMDGIRDYLEQMANHRLLSPEHPMQYCEHASLNAVLVYYCDWARQQGADVDVKAAVPPYISINNAELCSLVGNLLENAVEAIMAQRSGDKKLRARIRYNDGPPASLFIVVDNSYDSSVTQVDGNFASSKHGGNGLGTMTVKETAERHGGTASFDYDGKTFKTSVMLCLDKT